MNYFDLRAKRAATMRKHGWSLTALARHFGVSTMIVKNWLPEYQEPKKECRQRHHAGYRNTGSRNDLEHQQRIAGHQQRIQRGE